MIYDQYQQNTGVGLPPQQQTVGRPPQTAAPSSLFGSPLSSGLNLGGLGLKAASLIPGPQQPFLGAGAALLSVLGLLGAGNFDGLPKTAKTQAVGQNLVAGGDPLGQLVGQYMGAGAAAGHPLSDPHFGRAVEQVAGLLEGLTGQQIQPTTVTGQFQHPVNWSAVNVGTSQVPFQIPAGYQFLGMDSASLKSAYDLISKAIPYSGVSDPTLGADWSQILSQLTSQGLLQKYTGALGATSSLTRSQPSPSPLASVPQGRGFAPSAYPYPLTQQQYAPPYPA